MSQPKDDRKIPRVDRRDFLKLGAAATVGFLARDVASAAPQTLPPLPENPRTRDAMPTRNLGKTGYRVGICSLGGESAVKVPNNEDQAVTIVERALDLGVNYIDTAPRYGGDERWSQRYIGQVMKRRRREAFLATKTHDRTRDGSWRLLEESLKLLQTDHLDLWQSHNLARMDEVDRIFAPDGAVKAMVEAREQKIVRHLGVTGHADPHVLAEAIRRHPFDTILMAVNAADKHHLSFIEHLLPIAVEKQMGIIGMKVPARGRLLGANGITMRQADDYVLTLPVSTVIIGCDSPAMIEENVGLARTFNPLNETQMAQLAARVESIHRDALFFRRWT